jgi:fucose permease
MKDIKKRYLYISYASFGLIGFILSMRTNIFLFVQQSYLDGYGHIGTLVLISGLAMQLTLFLTGILIKHLGYKRMLLIGIAAFAVPVFMMGLTDSILFFDISYILFMLGFGIAIFVLNLFVSNLYPHRKANKMLMMHLYFAIGAIIGPKWISFFVDHNISWQYVTALSALPFIIAFLFALKTPPFKQDAPVSAPGGNALPETDISFTAGVMRVFKSPLVWCFTLLFMCAQTWEFGLGTWFVIFASDTKGLSSSQAAFYLSLFYGTYPLLRIVFSRFIHRLDLSILLICAFASCILFALLGAATQTMIFYSFTGFGISLMYPAILAFMQNVFGEGATTKIGFINMIGGLLQYVAIWSSGLIGDRFSIGAGFNYLILYLILGFLSLFMIRFFLREKKLS